MTKLEAVAEFVRIARADYRTQAQAKRLREACDAIGCSAEERLQLAVHFDYARPDGTAYPGRRGPIERTW